MTIYIHKRNVQKKIFEIFGHFNQGNAHKLYTRCSWWNDQTYNTGNICKDMKLYRNFNENYENYYYLVVFQCFKNVHRVQCNVSGLLSITKTCIIYSKSFFLIRCTLVDRLICISTNIHSNNQNINKNLHKCLYLQNDIPFKANVCKGGFIDVFS